MLFYFIDNLCLGVYMTMRLDEMTVIYLFFACVESHMTKYVNTCKKSESDAHSRPGTISFGSAVTAENRDTPVVCT